MPEQKQCCRTCVHASLGDRDASMSFRDCTAPIPEWAQSLLHDQLLSERSDEKTERLMDADYGGTDCPCWAGAKQEQADE